MDALSSSGGGAAKVRSSRGRRRLTILAMVSFVLSLLIQYATFVAPVAAVHNTGVFELDGNAVDQAAVPGDDWQNGTPGAADTLFIPGSVEKDGADTTYFKGGGSKDHHDISDWEWSGTDVAPDKDELLDVFAAVYEAQAGTTVYFGADKFDDSGDAQIGYWFFQDKVSTKADGSFNGVHKNGDVLILSDFTNGGSVSRICVYEWNPPGDDTDIDNSQIGCDLGNNVTLVAAGTECDVSTPDGAFDVCAVVNAQTETAPWTFTNKDGDHSFGAGQFFEGGINLSELFGGNAPCFSTFLAETRSSQEVEAQLKDFAMGSLDTCVPPDLTTDSSVSKADFGAQVTDQANLSGSHGPVEGTIQFYICGPADDTSAGCTIEDNAHKVGSPVTIAANKATSPAYTVGSTAAAVGTYCWRAKYIPAATSEYLATSHTDTDSECFVVAPAVIDIAKTADAASVNAGEQIGFTVTISNTGKNTALGVSLDDDLPGGAGVDWSIESQSGGFSISGSPQTESLEFGPTSLAAGASASVHIVSSTTKASCGDYDNTAKVTTTNDGQDTASDSTSVLCAEIDVAKSADAASVNAGEQIGFTVTISNNGAGLATGLSFTDSLPAGSGVSWTIDAANTDAGWSITGSAPNQQLVYTPTTLAGHTSTSAHIVSNTTKDSCKAYPNSASVSTTNDGSDQASDTTTVLCAAIDVAKTADAASVNAGEQIGFTVTISNNGDGAAAGLSFTDALPGGAGVDWGIESQSGGFSISGSPQSESLVFTPTTMAAHTSAWVHVVSNTTKDSCKEYPNSASVSTTNDGSDQASATTEVLCAAIDVAKTADADSVSAGEQIGFTVTLSNTGDGDATGLSFSDALPAGTGVSWTIDAANTDAGWSISGSAPNQGLVYSPTTLAAGASTKVHIVSNTTKDSCKVYLNTATVSAANDGSDVASDSTEVLCAEIDVEKAADADSVSAGEQIGFTVTLSNKGEGEAKGLSFSDALPAGTGVSWTIDAANTDAGWSISGSAPNQSLVYSPTTLAAGASTKAHVVSGTTKDSCKVYDNTASVSTTNDGSDTASDSTQVRCADIDVAKEADDATVNAGEPIGFKVTITNFGDGLATGLSFTDALPGGVGVDWSIDDQSGGFSITGTAPNQNLTFAPTSLAAGASAWVHIVSDTTPQSCKLYDNTASISTGNDGSDEASDQTMVECPDVTVNKEPDAGDNGSSVEAGGTATFTIVVSNVGDGLAKNVTLNDPLPNGIDWSDDSDACEITPDVGTTGQVLTCNFGDLKADGSVEIHVSGQTDETVCGSLDNEATVAADNEAQEDTENNSDTGEIMVECPELQITKDVAEAKYTAVGQILHYTIVVTNVGNVTLHDVIVTDIQAPDVACAPATPVPSLAVDESFTCTATHTITQADLDAGFYLNEACTDDGNGDGEIGANPVCANVTVFGQEVKNETNPPTQPNTAASVSGEQSAPANGSWLLIVGLGIALAAFVVATPQRGRKRR